MFEKLFGKLKKKEIPEEQTPQSNEFTTTAEVSELEQESKEAENIQSQINEVDSQLSSKIEEKIRNEFDSEFDADLSDLEECFEQLDDIKEDLYEDILIDTHDKALVSIQRQIILKVLEEKLISIGSSLEAYYNWVEQEELIDKEPEESINNSYTR